jgi:hypothetical protein
MLTIFDSCAETFVLNINHYKVHNDSLQTQKTTKYVSLNKRISHALSQVSKKNTTPTNTRINPVTQMKHANHMIYLKKIISPIVITTEKLQIRIPMLMQE